MTAVFRIHGTDYVYMRVPNADQAAVDLWTARFPIFDITLEE